MRAELQRRIQRYGWDRAAPYYESGWEEQLWPAQEQLLEITNPRPGDRLLDVSCGTGLVTLPLADLIQPFGKITGIDISDKMLEHAEARALKDGLKNVNYLPMDAEKLNFPSHKFDKVVCSLGLMYYPNPDRALREMHRVLKPGGQLSALVWGDRKNCGWAGIFPIVDRRVKTDVCPLFFQLGTGDTLQAALTQAGFDEIVIKRFTTDLVFAGGEQACVAAFWGGAVALAYHKFDRTTRNEVNGEYLASIQEYHKENRYRIPAEFVLVKANR